MVSGVYGGSPSELSAKKISPFAEYIESKLRLDKTELKYDSDEVK